MLKPLIVWITTDCGKFLKRWEYKSALHVSSKTNLYAGQEATLRTGHGTTDWFQIGKGVRQGCVLSPRSFNSYAEYIIQNAEQMTHKLGSRLPRELSATSDMQMIQS